MYRPLGVFVKQLDGVSGRAGLPFPRLKPGPPRTFDDKSQEKLIAIERCCEQRALERGKSVVLVDKGWHRTAEGCDQREVGAPTCCLGMTGTRSEDISGPDEDVTQQGGGGRSPFLEMAMGGNEPRPDKP